MAVQNHLEKIFEETYQSGQAAVPARTATVSYDEIMAAVNASPNDDIKDVGDWVAENYGIHAQWEYSRGVVTIRIPGTAEVEAGYVRKAILGWNGGARSIDYLAGDGYFEFTMTAVPRKVIVGLAKADIDPTSTQFNDATHAFYVRTDNPTSRIRVRESGVKPTPTPSWPTTKAKTQPRYRIQRRNGVVKYLLIDPDTGAKLWSYTSKKKSDGPAYLDAAFYRSGSYVEDPVMITPTDNPDEWNEAIAATTDGEISGEISFAGLLTDMDLKIISGEISFGCTLEGPQNFIQGSIMFTGQLLEELQNRITGTISLSGSATMDTEEGPDDYSDFFGAVLFTGSMGLQYITPMAVTGSISVSGLLSDDELNRVMGEISLSGQLGIPMTPANVFEWFSDLSMVTTFVPDPVWSVEFVSTLNGDIDISAGVLWEAGLDAALSVGDSYSFAAVLAAILQSGATFTGMAETYDLPDVQYAVNLSTGAMTTYRNFGFTSFATIDGVTYASRPDGVYRLRAGDDDGMQRDFVIDFGETDFGRAQAKAVDSVYFGLSTDGEQAFAKIVDDAGAEYVYRVTQYAPTARALVGRGLVSRRWGLRLEITDATELELDNIEFSVAVHGRRRMP